MEPSSRNLIDGSPGGRRVLERGVADYLRRKAIHIYSGQKPRDSSGLSRYVFGRNWEASSVRQDASSSSIVRRLTTLFPSVMLEKHAEQLGVVERDRTLQIPVLVWAFVFGFCQRRSRTLAGFRRCYNATADDPLSPCGFYQRLTPTLAEYLRDLAGGSLDEVAVPHTVSDEFDRFRDVIIADMTVLRLHQFLSEAHQGVWEEQAGTNVPL